MIKFFWLVLGVLISSAILFVHISFASNSLVPYADGFVYPVIKNNPTNPDEFVFNNNDPISNGWHGSKNGVGANADSIRKGHLGEDYSLTNGNSAGKRVYAAANGTVVEVMDSDKKYGWCDEKSHGWGRVIVIKHEAPEGAFFNTDGSIVSETYSPNDSQHPGSTEKNPTVVYTLYGHLSKRDLDVKPGDRVKKGQPIARIGSSEEVSEFPIAWTPHLHFEIKSQKGFNEGVWDKKNPGKHLEQWCNKTQINGIGSGYSYLSNYAPERYNPTRFIKNNFDLGTIGGLGSTIPSSAQSEPIQNKIYIKTKSGKLEVNNFLKKATDVGEGSYALAMTDDYHIVYYEPDHGFLIAINSRPAQLARLKAEAALLEILGIKKEDACTLLISLGVPYDVDPNMSGKEFGLSFCPDGILMQINDQIVIKSSKGEVTVNNFFKSARDEGSRSFSLKETSDYSIGYFQPDNSFQIALISAPLQSSREKAESALLDILGISKNDACKLLLHQGVPHFVDKTLSGRNYGLSFCPDGIAFNGTQIAEKNSSSVDSSHEQTQTINISRNIEGITLGMSLNEARAVLDKAMREGNISKDDVSESAYSSWEYDPKRERADAKCEEIPENSTCYSKAYSGPSEGSIELSTYEISYQTQTSRLVILKFYNDKLYRVILTPEAKGAIVQDALLKKYGSGTPIYHVLDFRKELRWRDPNTELRYYWEIHIGSKEQQDYSLTYSDTTLLNLMREDAIKKMTEREIENTKKENTPPEGF